MKNIVSKSFDYATKNDLDSTSKFLKNEIGTIYSLLKHDIDELLTRNEFNKSIDMLLTEIKSEREENKNIDIRLKRIEQHFPQAV